MATTSRIRLRRSAAQLHALAQVERRIRASDPHGRLKYLRQFTDAYQAYTSVLNRQQFEALLLDSGVLLIGDYHALPKCVSFTAETLQVMHSTAGRPLVLGLETVFSRDQAILDEWMSKQIDEYELRERIRFDAEWGFDWEPFYRLLVIARELGVPVYGLDCMPRGDMRRIGLRDRHAADKIAELRQRYPDAAILVLFGESHLAPGHLPALVKEHLRNEQVLTILQNVDALYWRAAGERFDSVFGVRVSDDVVCVFNSTPLEKYESYRMYLGRWTQMRAGSAPDLAPTLFNLIQALLRFLHVDTYSSVNGSQPKFLVDLLPEVCSRTSLDAIRKQLARHALSEEEIRTTVARVERDGSCYLPALNVFFVLQFQMAHIVEQVARFVHCACSGALQNPAVITDSVEDRFYARTVETALGFFSSRVLYPARPSARETGLYQLYAQPREAIEEQTIYSYREYMEMIDFIVLHRDWELNHHHYHDWPELIEKGIRYEAEKFEFVTRQLGSLLGSELYDAYLAGHMTRRFIRPLFFRDLRKSGAARGAYFTIARTARKSKKRWVA